MNAPKQITITANADALYEMMELIMSVSHTAAGPDAEPTPMFCLAAAIQAQIEAACPELIGTGFSEEYQRCDQHLTTMRQERAALLAVEAAAHALMMTPGVEKFDVPHYKLAKAISMLGNVRNQKTTPTF